MELLIKDGECMIPQEEIDNYKNNHDNYMFDLSNLSQTVEESDRIENEIMRFLRNLQNSEKRITKFSAFIDYCDESHLNK